MTVEGKNDAQNPKTSNNKDMPIADAGLDQTVSEGSTVVLNGNGSTTNHNRKITSYSWTFVSDKNYEINLTNTNTANPEFKAPYIIDEESGHIKPSITLTFQLKVSDDKGLSSNPSEVNIKVKRVQKAIIFQGGASLGAYEAGVFSALVEKLPRLNSRPLFDIVAGTSIGSMNASIIVSHIVKEKGNWDQHLVEKLERFWRYQTSPTISDGIFNNPYLIAMWDLSHTVNKMYKQFWDNILNQTVTSPFIESIPFLDTIYNSWRDYFIDGWYVPAKGEAARRYYSSKEFVTKGTPRVASGIIPWSIFGKFLDLTDQSNYLPRPDNKHIHGFSLKETLQQFADFPIKSTEGQPRFLLVTVDVQTGDAITFDSYSDEAQYHNDTNSFIHSENGIEIDHVLASGTFPDFFDYPEFEVQSGRKAENLKMEKRIFWDGGFRSNTPLREVIQAHTDYWRNKHRTTTTTTTANKEEKIERDIPDLEVYIADLWPSALEEQPISFDHDFVEDRRWDIIFGDRTDYDEKVANVVTDYLHIARQLRNLAKKKGASDDELDAILEKYTSSKGRLGLPPRKYKTMLEERFRLLKVVRIDRKDLGDEVQGKVFDYTSKTIDELMKEGRRDTLDQIQTEPLKDGIANIANKIGVKQDKEDGKKMMEQYIKKLEEKSYHIQKTIKAGNSHNGKIVGHQLADFINEVKSMPDKVDGVSIKEEKAPLIEAAKGLQ
jgi:NTE family protein